ncbi:MAG: hypothetical protein M3375_06820 [Actinomycetota bacterium]|nr:hypothetical protein [Actinomycetota bacterium]
MSAGGGPELDRPRDTGALFRHALGLLAARPLAYLAIGAAFAVPIQLAVSGVGLEQLTARYDERVEPVELAVGALTSYVLVTPLTTVACALLVVDASASAARTIVRALELSTPLLLAAIAAAFGVALGLFLLILPGLYLVVRWFLFPQAVALEQQAGIAGERSPSASGGAQAERWSAEHRTARSRASTARSWVLEPLRRSGQLIEGFWFRAAGVVVVANLVALVPGSLMILPFEAWAAELGREWPGLAGSILAETVTAPVVAVVATLLFFDLKARHAQPF